MFSIVRTFQIELEMIRHVIARTDYVTSDHDEENKKRFCSLWKLFALKEKQKSIYGGAENLFA